MSSKPISVTLSNLSYILPDGRLLFESLSKSLDGHRYGLVGDNGSGKTTLFRIISGYLKPSSGAVSVNGSLAYMPQTPEYTDETIIADQFGLGPALSIIKKAEKGEASAEELADIDWEFEDEILQHLNTVGLGGLALSDKVENLSGGQKTRLAFAAIQYSQPDILLLDEPTNNLDKSGREFVSDVLHKFSGLSLTISHDRYLLNTCDVILELSEQGLNAYGGNWNFYRAQKAVELEQAEQAFKSAKSNLTQIERQGQKAKERKDRKDAAGRQKNKRGVNAKVLMNAQAERAENSSGAGRTLIRQRQSAAASQLDAANSKIARITPLKIDLPTTGLPTSREILKLVEATIGFQAGPTLARRLSISMVGPERIAIIGPNGTGKSTLLNTIASHLPLLSGQLQVTNRLAFLDQSVSCLRQEETLLQGFLRLNPMQSVNDAHSALARFKFRNEAAHKLISSLSGGERLRAGLACTLCSKKPPELLMLDEPTNHLDIASIEIIEAALLGFDGGLMIVSHDDFFLKHVNCTRFIEINEARST